MRCEYLGYHPEHLPVLAELCGKEWEHFYPGWNADAARKEFACSRLDGQIPCTLIALEGGQTLLGTVSLIYDDLPGWPQWNPWLASLYVLPEHRGRGIGAFLVKQTEEECLRMEIPEAYLFTESAGGFFEKLGWEKVARASCNGHPVQVHRRIFPACSSVL